MRASVAVWLAIGFVACGGGDRPAPPAAPTAPTAPAPQIQPARWTLAGQITDGFNGQPVSAATLTINGSAVTVDGEGRWRLEGTGTTQPRLAASIQAQGFVSRETFVAWQAGGRQEITLDLLPDRPPVSLAFYRELVRDGQSTPQQLQPLRRWTTNPNFYVNTFNPKTGRSLEPDEIALVVQALRESVPQMTGGRFAAAAIETGDTPREPVRDWINVSFIYDQQGEFCGQAYVGANPGRITMNYDRCFYSCGSLKVQPETIAHEVGHAMGFYHAGGGGIMDPLRSRRCTNLRFSEREQLHARLAYSRTPGNLDPDRDPEGFAAFAATESPVTITCR